jgi:hypothetical protein
MKIAVVGSRNFPELKLVHDKLDEIINSRILKGEEIFVISGGAIGVDKEVEVYCIKHDVPIEVIRPINKNDKMSYLFRNIEIITKADHIIAFWDGKSKGTEFVINYARARGKLPIIIKSKVFEYPKYDDCRTLEDYDYTNR